MSLSLRLECLYVTSVDKALQVLLLFSLILLFTLIRIRRVQFAVKDNPIFV